jgi:hypothetical protein
VNPPDFKVQPDDGTPRHVPDSTAAFTVTQARARGDLPSATFIAGPFVTVAAARLAM